MGFYAAGRRGKAHQARNRAGNGRGGGAFVEAFKRKMKSAAGASITFALLLFMVCAVTGSLILVAGTAASGRFSRIAAMDQRYYSVMSAAELLVSEIEGSSCKVEKVTETTDVHTYHLSGSLISSTSSQITRTLIDGVEKDDFYRAPSLWSEAADYLTDSAGGEGALTRKYTLSATDGTGSTVDSLLVRVTETVTKDGLMTLDVSGGDAKEVYTVRLTFSSQMARETDQQAVNGTPEEVNAVSYSVTNVTTDIERTTVSWKKTGIRKFTGVDA